MKRLSYFMYLNNVQVDDPQPVNISSRSHVQILIGLKDKELID